MGSRRFCPPLIVVWSIVACGDDDPTTLSSSAPGTSLSAPISDDPIVATPSAAEPGDLVELTFPTDLDRGANWHLIRWNGRPEERRLGTACVSKCRSRGSPCH